MQHGPSKRLYLPTNLHDVIIHITTNLDYRSLDLYEIKMQIVSAKKILALSWREELFVQIQKEQGIR
jgi:hypothetical protein